MDRRNWAYLFIIYLPFDKELFRIFLLFLVGDVTLGKSVLYLVIVLSDPGGCSVF